MLANQIVELLANGRKRLGQSRLDVHRVHSDVECGHARVGELVDDVGAQQPRIGRQVDPEIFLRRVVGDAMDEVRPEQRLAAHERQHAAAGSVQPVDGALRRIFRHAFYFVVEGPAVVAVEIALELGEQIGDERMEVARGHTRADIGKSQPCGGGRCLPHFHRTLLGRRPALIKVDRPQ